MRCNRARRTCASDDFTTDRRTKEESKSAFVQYSQNWDTAVPMQMALGLRYEKTEVTSSALVPTRHRHQLGGQQRVLGGLRRHRTSPTLEGEYDYVLPSLDFAFDVRDNMKVRASRTAKASAVRAGVTSRADRR